MLMYAASHGRERLRESIYVAHNATPGTGIVSKDAPTSYSATSALMTIYNSATVAAGNNHWIIPMWLRLTATTANTNATNLRLIGNIDDKDRYSSGGTALTTALSSLTSTSVDTRDNYAQRTPKATIWFGDLTTNAVGTINGRVFSTMVSQAVLTADETVEIHFGENHGSQADNIKVVPPVWIGRGSSLVIHEMAAAQSADPAFEVEFCYIEHGHPREAA